MSSTDTASTTESSADEPSYDNTQDERSTNGSDLPDNPSDQSGEEEEEFDLPYRCESCGSKHSFDTPDDDDDFEVPVCTDCHVDIDGNVTITYDQADDWQYNGKLPHELPRSKRPTYENSERIIQYGAFST